MPVVITPMTEADLEAALAIDEASFHDRPREVRERQLREELARTWGRLRGARVDGALVGYVLFWHVTDEIHLLDVAVALTSRRRGIGSALLDEVESYARTQGAAKVLLEVRASNVAAIALYEGRGFVRFNVRSRYYDDGEDGIEMVLEGDNLFGKKPLEKSPGEVP